MVKDCTDIMREISASGEHPYYREMAIAIWRAKRGLEKKYEEHGFKVEVRIAVDHLGPV